MKWLNRKNSYFYASNFTDALCFVACAMIYVAVEELNPEAQQEKDHNKSADIAMIGYMVGFTVMMLDITSG